MNLSRELATIGVLVRRDLLRLVREKSRLFGVVAQPLLFWIMIGSGMGSSFAMPGGAAGVDYLEYFFPGVTALVVLFTAIFSTMSLIEDRHAGFLQAVLVAPSSRLSIVLGKTLGGVIAALVQAALFLALAPLAGFDFARIDWAAVVLVLSLLAIGLTALGFALAWWLDSTHGYHAVMSVALFPAWILSGAMFPLEGASPWLRAAMRANPMTYAVEGLRAALYGGTAPGGTGALGLAPSCAPLVLAGFATAMLLLAARACAKRA